MATRGVCGEILELLDKGLDEGWPQDVLLRAIQGPLSLNLKRLLYDVDDRSVEMICALAQYDSQILLEETDEDIKWEIVAKWRVCLIFWGGFVQELQPGELEDGEALPLEDIAADMNRCIVEAGGLGDDVEARDELREFLCNIHASLIDRAEDLIEPVVQELQVRQGPLIDNIRAIVSRSWREGCETLAVVYLDHVLFLEKRRVQQYPVVAGKVSDDSKNDGVVLQALGIVALHALGGDNCLLPLRVCRGVCSRADVSRKLRDRAAFSYVSFFGRKVLARGFRTTWPWLVARSVEQRGAAMPEDYPAKYYKTVGPGPELFAIAGSNVFYNHESKWHKYNSAKLESFSEDVSDSAWVEQV